MVRALWDHREGQRLGEGMSPAAGAHRESPPPRKGTRRTTAWAERPTLPCPSKHC